MQARKAITIVAICVTFWFVSPIVLSGAVTSIDWFFSPDGVRVLGALVTLLLVILAAKMARGLKA